MANEKKVGVGAADTLEQVKNMVTEMKEQMSSPLPAGGNLVGKVDENTEPQALTGSMIQWADLEEKLEDIRQVVMDPGIAEFDENYYYNVPFAAARELNVAEGEITVPMYAHGDHVIDRVYLIANDSENDVKIMLDSLNEDYGHYPRTANITLHPGECIKNLDVRLREIYVNTKDTNAVGSSKLRFLFRCSLKEKLG